MSLQRGLRSTPGIRFWILAWCVAAVFHLTQAIWVSGFRDFPGDLGDARFNQLVLEHGFRSLEGAYAWESPGMFHPVDGTLGLSDTHAGTLVIYAIARWIGCSGGHAFQAWFLALAALNAWAMTRVLTALRVDPWLSGPLAFLGCASMATVAQVGSHAQMLPHFATLLMLGQLIRFGSDRCRGRLVMAAGWAAWQLAAAPYLAFFAGCLLGPLIWAAWRPAPGREQAREHRGDRPPPWMVAALATIGGALFFGAVHAHFVALGRGFAHPQSELFLFAPSWPNWLTPPRGALIDRWTPPTTSLNCGDALFFGLTPWVLGAMAAVWAVKNPKHPQARWVAGCVIALGLAGILFTAPDQSTGSLFAHLASWFEPLRAFRSSARFIVLIPPLLAVASGVALTAWLGSPSSHQNRRHALTVGVAIIAALETITLHQPGAPIATAEARTESVVRAWQAAGDRPVLAFAPTFSNQPGHLVQLDAWSAALALGRRTINGYSGSGPETHSAFAFLATPESAGALINLYGINADDVSIVTEWEPSIAARLGITRHASRPIAQLAGWDLQPSAWSLFAPIETFTFEGHVVHQFTPPAEARFPLPDSATRVTVLTGMRPGSYDGDGASDGVSITWSAIDATGRETVLWSEHLDPRTRPEHCGFRPVDFNVPVGANRTLILRTGHGPAGDGRWDWPVFGELRVR